MIEEKLGDDGTIIRLSIQIDTPSSNGREIFELPMFGPGNHETVMNQIDSNGFYRPTLAQVLKLLVIAEDNSRYRTLKDILDCFKHGYIWTSTQKFTTSNGVYVFDNINGKMPKKESSLIKLKDSRDKRVRYRRKGFSYGVMSIEEAKANKYLRALIDGTKNLKLYERVVDMTYSGKFKSKVCINFENSESNDFRYIAVGLDSNAMLRIQDYTDEYTRAHSMGIIKTSKKRK